MPYLSWGHANLWAICGCVRSFVVKTSMESKCVGLPSSFDQIRQPACKKVSPSCISALPPPFREFTKAKKECLVWIDSVMAFETHGWKFLHSENQSHRGHMAQTLMWTTPRTLGKLHEIKGSPVVRANVCTLHHKTFPGPLSPEFLSVPLQRKEVKCPYTFQIRKQKN